ncbi:Re/Si-specific NAD(P)(+) transhydrogenase subunit alpha [bacterium]|nr:MAG: Re/Si-specific NAD(P)(+) transhydrogenase subunit alpha [bacterium]
MPTVFVPTEIRESETRAAASPDTVTRLIKLGMSVQIQAGAGAASHISDKAYEAAGATIVSDVAAGYGAADLVFKLNPPTPAEIASMREGTTLVSFVNALTDKDIVEALNARKISSIAMELVPRITRAQKMDALSSQANLAGYKAVIMAADHLPKIFPMLMTAAGTIQPARVVIMGAGVAGLQAIATAKRLGAVVEVSDVRPAVKEQVESLGGKFIEVPTDGSAEDEGGYATEQSEEFLAKQRELVREKIVNADVVITTAAIPGRPAPKLVTDDMVEAMRGGSVIVDLAVASGGNCTLSEAGQIVQKHGVTIIGKLEIPSLVAANATDMYAKNVLNLVGDMVDKEKGFHFDFEDEVVTGSVVCHKGEICHARVRDAHGLSPLNTPQEA